MDARLREATTAEISTALGKLFRALPPRKASPAELEESYLIACHKATKHAIETVVVKLIRGELDKLSKSFAPSPAELSAAIRDEMAFVQKQIDLAQERMQLEDRRPVGVRPKLLHERQSEARGRMADERRALLHSGVTHAVSVTKLRECPTGSAFISITGEIYGPPGSSDNAPPVPVCADDIPW